MLSAPSLLPRMHLLTRDSMSRDFSACASFSIFSISSIFPVSIPLALQDKRSRHPGTGSPSLHRTKCHSADTCRQHCQPPQRARQHPGQECSSHARYAARILLPCLHHGLAQHDQLLLELLDAVAKPLCLDGARTGPGTFHQTPQGPAPES